MLLTFVIFSFLAFALLWWRKRLGREFWILLIVAACVFSLLFANASVRSVWNPHPQSIDVPVGEYQGTSLRSKLSYPVWLSVYHSTDMVKNNIAYGQARFSICLATAKILEINGTFSFFAGALGDKPLAYKINFLFSDPDSFYYFLIALFTLFDTIGALLGVVVAKVLYKTVAKPQ
jgi:hypothetical protein